MNIRLKKLLILLVFAICISIIITGYRNNKEGNDVNDNEVTDEDVKKSTWQIIDVIKSDLRNNKLTIKISGYNSNMEDFDFINDIHVYLNSSKITDKQEDVIGKALSVALFYQDYFEHDFGVGYKKSFIKSVKNLEDALGEETGLIELVE